MWWQDLLWALLAAIIIGAITFAFERPRKYVVDFWRRGRNRPFSQLHVVLGGRWPSVWTRVQSVEGPRIAWQCELIVTNGGNRTDAPVRGEIRWNQRAATFLTPLRPAAAGPGRVTELAPEQAATLIVNAWTLLEPGDNPAGDLRAEVVLFDRFGGSHKTAVTFSPPPRAVVQSGKCGSSTVKDDEFIYCDQKEGHAGNHSRLDETTGISTTWDDDGGSQDFLVMGRQ
jgi:hypothetical protein